MEEAETMLQLKVNKNFCRIM